MLLRDDTIQFTIHIIHTHHHKVCNKKYIPQNDALMVHHQCSHTIEYIPCDDTTQFSIRINTYSLPQNTRQKYIHGETTHYRTITYKSYLHGLGPHGLHGPYGPHPYPHNGYAGAYMIG